MVVCGHDGTDSAVRPFNAISWCGGIISGVGRPRLASELTVHRAEPGLGSNTPRCSDTLGSAIVADSATLAEPQRALRRVL